jgi:hypothetical protein
VQILLLWKSNNFYILFMSVALDIQHAKSIRHIILSFLAYPALPCFSTLSKKGTIFEKKKIKHKMRVSIFSTTFV